MRGQVTRGREPLRVCSPSSPGGTERERMPFCEWATTTAAAAAAAKAADFIIFRDGRPEGKSRGQERGKAARQVCPPLKLTSVHIFSIIVKGMHNLIKNSDQTVFGLRPMPLRSNTKNPDYGLTRYWSTISTRILNNKIWSNNSWSQSSILNI